MGWFKHNAILIKTGGEAKAKRIHKKAKKIFDGDFQTLVSDIIISKINGFCTILIAPDGSQEGWAASNLGNKKREIFRKYLKKEIVDFVEVEYANEMADEKTPTIVDYKMAGW